MQGISPRESGRVEPEEGQKGHGHVNGVRVGWNEDVGMGGMEEGTNRRRRWDGWMGWMGT
jgi:hypothetical protein